LHARIKIFSILAEHSAVGKFDIERSREARSRGADMYLRKLNAFAVLFPLVVSALAWTTGTGPIAGIPDNRSHIQQIDPDPIGGIGDIR
jgi:hypothetical protein